MRIFFESESKAAYWPDDLRSFIGKEKEILVRYYPNISTEKTVKFELSKLPEAEQKMKHHCSGGKIK